MVALTGGLRFVPWEVTQELSVTGEMPSRILEGLVSCEVALCSAQGRPESGQTNEGTGQSDKQSEKE
jgi:hypothetical protein